MLILRINTPFIDGRYCGNNVYVQVLLNCHTLFYCFIYVFNVINTYYLHAIYIFWSIGIWKRGIYKLNYMKCFIHRNIVSRKTVIIVCKQFNFINFVAMSFYNTSKALDFKPDDNCVSPCGQTGRGQARVNFVVMATWNPTRRVTL
jgi:hypothetical protein